MLDTLKAWGEAAAKALGLADFAAKWVKEKQDEKTGGALHELQDRRAQVEAAVEQQETRDDIRRMSDSELNSRLRDYTRASDRQPRR